MTTTSYSLMQWFDKWLVVKAVPWSVRKWYLKDVRNGKYTWVSDPLYAKGYSRKTADRHLRNMRANDDFCEEDF